MRTFYVGSIVSAILLAAVGAGYAGPLADATADSLWGIQLGGYLDVSYTYDFNDPNVANSAIGGRAFAGDDNQINLDAFQLYIDKLPKDAGEVGFRFDILAGEDARPLGDLFGGNTNDISIYQAFVSYVAPVGNGLTIDVGRFIASAGYESIESPRNDQFSRSLNFWSHPWTVTGLRFTYPINDQWEVTANINQGWNIVEDNNESWSYNGAIRWMPLESVYIQEAVFYGPDNWNMNGPGFTPLVSNDDNSFMNELSVAWDINESWRVGAQFIYETTENGIGTKDASLWGVAGYVRYNVNEDLYLALRGEYVDDNDGMFVYLPNISDNYLWEITATLGYTLTEGLLTRLEYRHDGADIDYYPDKDGADDQQDTIAVELIYSF